MSAVEDADRQFRRLFPAVYLRLHARREKDGHRPAAQGMAVLQHLTLSGPLTIGEAARHFSLAQSVVSEIVDRLAARGLVERMRDRRDRRRVLVWLTPSGIELLEREREVLSPELTRAAMAKMKPAQRRALIEGMAALIAAADRIIERKERT